MDLGGTAAAQFDRLEVGGAATLAGALDVSLLDGFQPALGQQFEVMTFASRSGTIPTFAGLDVGNGLDLQPLQGDGDLVLQVVGGSGNPTPTPAGTTSPTGAPTAGASPTPTSTAMPGGITISGRVLVPGPSGLIAAQGLAVDVFACAIRRDCLADPGTALAHTVIASDGTFTVEIAVDLVPPGTMLVLDTSSGDVSCRQLITPPALAGLALETQLTIDPISEAAVRLLDAAGLENYTDDAIDAVIAAVRAANADSNFAGLTADQAKDTAKQVAARDPTVRMVRLDNLLSCVGDCDGDHTVQIQELILAVRIADGEVPVSSCKEIDANLDGMVAVNELVAAVNRALSGCS